MSPDAFADFYAIGDPMAHGAFRGRFVGAYDSAPRFSRAEGRPTNAVPVPWAMGRATPADIIWTTTAGPMIVSARTVRILTEHRFTGWATYPVAVSDKRGDEVEGYVGLAITGRCDPVDIARSSVVLREYPGGWFPMFRGRFVDLDSWDGSDLFMERADDRGDFTLCRYATSRVVRALKRQKVRHLRTTPVSDYESDAVGYGIGNPHRLPSDFEERLADAYSRQGIPKPLAVEAALRRR